MEPLTELKQGHLGATRHDITKACCGVMAECYQANQSNWISWGSGICSTQRLAAFATELHTALGQFERFGCSHPVSGQTRRRVWMNGLDVHLMCLGMVGGLTNSHIPNITCRAPPPAAQTLTSHIPLVALPLTFHHANAGLYKAIKKHHSTINSPSVSIMTIIILVIDSYDFTIIINYISPYIISPIVIVSPLMIPYNDQQNLVKS